MKRVISLILFITLTASSSVVAQEKTTTNSIVNIGGESFHVHTVIKGETLFSISKLYETTEATIVSSNPSSAGILNIGMIIKIPFKSPKYTKRELKKRDRKFIKHIILSGETAYSIAKQYSIPMDILIEDNPNIDIITLPLNYELNIRKKEIGESNHIEIKNELIEYAENLNSVSDKFLYHVIEKDDTLYKLSKKYSISINEIKRVNNIIDENLKLGEVIIVGEVDNSKYIAGIDIDQDQLAVDTIKTESLYPTNRRYNRADIVAKISQENCVNIALFLPIQNSRQDANFLEFYQGALLAIESLKDRGLDVNLDLFNSDKSSNKVSQAITDGELDDMDLIIGPIYEEVAAPIIKFAEHKRVPVISPLATFKEISSPVLFQLAPTDESKYSKLSTILLGDKNIIVIKSSQNDTLFAEEIEHILPQNYTTLSYNKSTITMDINTSLSPTKENVFIIVASNPFRIDEILARISSVQNNKLARSLRIGEISVIGTSKWAKHPNIDRNLFFKLQVNFISSYFTDKNDPRISSFDKNYIAAFRSIPGQYAYRAYDAVKLFGNTVINRQNELVIDAINSPELELLQMNYIFEKGENSESISNTNWGLVRYNSDYTIEIE